MMAEIIIGGIKKDFIKSIKRIAREMEVPETTIQIRLKFGSTQENPILYAVTRNYILVEHSTFKKVMDVTLDLKGSEMMLTPPLYEVMKKHCIEAECESLDDFTAFLFYHDEQIGVSMFNKERCFKVSEVSKLF
jgi:hypothetical protein